MASVFKGSSLLLPPGAFVIDTGVHIPLKRSPYAPSYEFQHIYRGTSNFKGPAPFIHFQIVSKTSWLASSAMQLKKTGNKKETELLEGRKL